MNVLSQIVFAPPPNIAKIETSFPAVIGKKGILFAYGDIIYNPSKAPVPPWIAAHEAVHSDQQALVGSPELWWDIYIQDRHARFQWEVAAHAAEFRAFRRQPKPPNRKARAQHVAGILDRLSAPMYGPMASRKDAQAAFYALFEKAPEAA